jgi:hypothetical protein
MLLRRTGDATGKKQIGPHNWYQQGCRLLIEKQDARSGSWKGIGIQQDEAISTSVVLLFLGTPIQQDANKNRDR